LRLSLDSNILVYAADNEAGERHRRAKDLLRRTGSGDCVLTLQSLGEFFHVATRKGKVAPSDAVSVVQSLRATFPIAAADAAVLEVALSAVLRHGLSFWDAMLWATVQQAGCRVLLSEDFQDGRKLGRVTFVNPFEPANQALLDRALPPPAT
jgi:predicted nucleic acid-binding protein